MKKYLAILTILFLAFSCNRNKSADQNQPGLAQNIASSSQYSASSSTPSSSTSTLPTNSGYDFRGWVVYKYKPPAQSGRAFEFAYPGFLKEDKSVNIIRLASPEIVLDVAPFIENLNVSGGIPLNADKDCSHENSKIIANFKLASGTTVNICKYQKGVLAEYITTILQPGSKSNFTEIRLWVKNEKGDASLPLFKQILSSFKFN